MAILADTAKRSRAVDPAASFHLEAPAGSGKTFLLSARFLRLLGLVDHPQQILALTFTNKAAGEMRERVCRCLERASRGEPAESEADAELLGYAKGALAAHGGLDQLLLTGEILRIQTFHSFCYAAASQAPLEAGIAPGSTLMDETEQEFFLRETVDAALREIASRGPEDPARLALGNRLLYLNNSWRLLAAEMEDLVRRREGIMELVQVLGQDRATGFLAERVRELVETALEVLKRAFESCTLGRDWEGFLADISRAGAEAARSLPPRVPPASWESLGDWVRLAATLLTNDGKPRKQFGPKTGFYSGFAKTGWGEAIRCLPQETAEKLYAIRAMPSIDSPVWDPETLWDLVLLFHSVLETYEARCRARRAIDFPALEMAALRLFDSAAPSDLQLILDQRIRHILVDEFQDTSRGQWELLQKLCAGWGEGDGRTLFMVGDPKQSIYSFRKAEVKLFMDAARGLPLEGGATVPVESLVLDTNFRSRPHLIAWCNDLFGRTVMARPAAEYDEVPFSPAVPPSRDNVVDVKLLPLDGGGRVGVKNRAISTPSPCPSHQGRGVHGALSLKSTALPLREGAAEEEQAVPELALFLEWPDRESARAREARWLAEAVARLVREDPDAQTAILLFSRTHLPVYLEALQERKIPVQVKEGLMLTERPEVRCLWQLCRALVLPHDDLAWAAQLRSPWLKLDFDRVLALSGEPPDLWVEKIQLFSEKDAEVERFWRALSGAFQHLGHEPLARVVESAWLELGGAGIAARTWGSRGINCCRRFLDMVRRAEEGEPVRTLARLEQLLEKSYEPVDPDTASSNVFLMTVHGAKGLEFDTVFLPFMDRNPNAGNKGLPPPYMLERMPGSGEYLLAPRPDRLMGERDPLYDHLRTLRARRVLGEARRLFYVAATRARNRLVMSGVAKKKGPGFTAGNDSPLGWLNAHYGLEDLVGLGDVPVPEAAETTAGETLRRLQQTVQGEDGNFRVLVEPEGEGGEIVDSREESRPAVLHPAEFTREKPAPAAVSPSSLPGSEPAEAAPGPAHSLTPCRSDLWGTLIHRLLARFGSTGELPPPGGIESFLRREGVSESDSAGVAAAAVAEVEACLRDPWLERFYAVPEEDRKVEWPLEAVRDEGSIYSGVVDLAAKIDGRWELVDFKSSRPLPGETVEAFCRREAGHYRPQLEAYRRMWAKLAGVEEAAVEVFLYWTAPGKASALR